MTEFSELRAELAQHHAENSRRLDSLQLSHTHLTDHLSELHQDVRQINGTLNGPDGILVRLDRAQGGVNALAEKYEKCTARRKHEANSTAADGIAALTKAGARSLLSADSVPPNRVQVAREKTKQERLRLGKRIATVAGLVLLGATGGAGLLQLLSPAQASQPAAASSASTH